MISQDTIGEAIRVLFWTASEALTLPDDKYYKLKDAVFVSTFDPDEGFIPNKSPNIVVKTTGHSEPVRGRGQVMNVDTYSVQVFVIKANKPEVSRKQVQDLVQYYRALVTPDCLRSAGVNLCMPKVIGESERINIQDSNKYDFQGFQIETRYLEIFLR